MGELGGGVGPAPPLLSIQGLRLPVPPAPACPRLLSPQATRFSSVSQGPSPLEDAAPTCEYVCPPLLTRSFRNSQSGACLGAPVSYRCSDR